MLVFVVCSVLALGMTYSVAQLVEPLRDFRLDAKELLANFVLVPLLVFVLLTAGIGYALGRPARETRVVSALGTGQRNIAAALVVVGQNFTDPDVLVMLVVGAVLMLALLMPLAGELGNRSQSTDSTPGVAPDPPHWPQDAGAESEES